jgi:gamma-glutamyl phosphate reductase
MDMKCELNTYCSSRHEHIINAMDEIVVMNQATNSKIENLSNIFKDKESTYNLELMCALNLLALHKVFKLLNKLEPTQEYLDPSLKNYLIKIVNALKSSEFLSLAQFREFSDQKTLAVLLTDINQMDIDNGISKLYNGDIVISV